MFGFLDSPCKRCNPADHSIYRAYFCGVSTQLARDYGNWARSLTNRDSTFVSLLGASLEPEEPRRESLTCCNPLAKERNLYSCDPHSRYAAAVTICGIWTKLRDDSMDETWLRRGVSRTLMAALERSVGKAEAILISGGFPVETVHQALGRQESVELDSSRDWETCSEPTAVAFGKIFGHSATSESNPKLEAAGASLGRIIYMLDAVKDQETDRSRGRFNPLIESRRTIAELWDWLGAELKQVEQAFSAISFFRNESLLQSILFDGVGAKVAAAGHGVGTRASFSSETASKRKKKRRKKRSPDQKSRWYESCCDPCLWCPGDCGCGSGTSSAGDGCGVCDCGGCDSCGCDC
tara:strand:+ start:3177 stop:4229 length:1053 start_codon:yes stop_codon:yes gene_type:complete